MADFDDYFDLYNKGAYREAYAVLRDIMDTQSGWSKVGDMYVWSSELELLVNDDVRKAHELLDKAHELGCHFMDDFYSSRGYVLWRLGDRERGIQDLEKSVEINPTLTNLTNLAKVLSYDHDKRAMRVCRLILEQDPKNCSAHIYLGIEAAKSGDRDKALLMAKRAENLASTSYNFFDIGWLYHELGLFQRAVNAYLEANRRRREPTVPLYAVIAACYLSLGDCDRAIEYAIRAVDLNFNDENAKNVLLVATEKEGAAPISDWLIEEHSDTCLAFVLLAQKALKQKNSSKAHKMLSKAKQLEPSPVEMYYIGRLYHVLGLCEKALNIYLEKIPVFEETWKLCKYFKISPFNSIASGSLLISVSKKESEKLENAFKREINGVSYLSLIGEFTKKGEPVYVIEGDKKRVIHPTGRDDITRII